MDLRGIKVKVSPDSQRFQQLPPLYHSVMLFFLNYKGEKLETNNPIEIKYAIAILTIGI